MARPPRVKPPHIETCLNPDDVVNLQDLVYRFGRTEVIRTACYLRERETNPTAPVSASPTTKDPPGHAAQDEFAAPQNPLPRERELIDATTARARAGFNSWRPFHDDEHRSGPPSEHCPLCVLHAGDLTEALQRANLYRIED
jgi:hypothetical protein